MTDTPEYTDPEPDAPTAAVTGAGSRLREARERKGISPAEVAAQLHLHEHIIVALEQGDHDRLPAPIYVRGYVRAYARLLGLDEEELLALYQPAESPELRTVGMPPPAQRALVQPRLPWRILGLLLLAVIGGLALVVLPGLWERFSGDDPDTAVGTEAPSLPATRPGSPETQAEAGIDSDAAIRLPTLTTPQPEPAPESAPEPSIPAPSVPESPRPEASPPAAEAVVPAEPTPAPTPAEPASVLRRVRLQLSQESWISIRDGGGEALLVGLYPAGSEHRVSGRPPLQVVLGNAVGVELSVDGRPYDLTGYDPGSVARFTLD
ncbi:MAG TPA: RodZ domain-containing protein [Thiohalobacter sp.]|nr:RodZ domain-containing protein [Thiohalobacter sp.]